MNVDSPDRAVFTDLERELVRAARRRSAELAARPRVAGKASRSRRPGALVPVLAAAITVAVVVVAVTSLGRGRHAQPAVATGPPSALVPVTPRERSNEQLARSDAAQLLARIELPRGAVRVGNDLSSPAQLGISYGGILPGGNQVDVHAFWRVPGAPSAVSRWIESHAPAGTASSATGSGGRGRVTLHWNVTFGYRPVPGRLSVRELTVTTAAARGGGTAVRADAEAVWVIPRPSASFVPSSVDRIEWRPASGTSGRTFTSRRTVREIVGWLNSVPLERPAPGSPCYSPTAFARGFRLLLVTADRQAPTATATWIPCGPIALDVGGMRYYPRIDPAIADGSQLAVTFMGGSAP